MRKKTEALVISFGTTTEAMKMERHCEREGLPGRLIPIPREITAGCGMAWKAKPTEKELLQQAIVFEDAKTLTTASGVGKKTAERIVLELKDKFSMEGVKADEMIPANPELLNGVQDARGEAVDALIALGYTRAEASAAMAGVKDQDLTAEEYIKLALKNLF